MRFTKCSQYNLPYVGQGHNGAVCDCEEKPSDNLSIARQLLYIETPEFPNLGEDECELSNDL